MVKIIPYERIRDITLTISGKMVARGCDRQGHDFRGGDAMRSMSRSGRAAVQNTLCKLPMTEAVVPVRSRVRRV